VKPLLAIPGVALCCHSDANSSTVHNSGHQPFAEETFGRKVTAHMVSFASCAGLSVPPLGQYSFPPLTFAVATKLVLMPRVIRIVALQIGLLFPALTQCSWNEPEDATVVRRGMPEA
jgi:hypothetical protein